MCVCSYKRHKEGGEGIVSSCRLVMKNTFGEVCAKLSYAVVCKFFVEPLWCDEELSDELHLHVQIFSKKIFRRVKYLKT